MGKWATLKLGDVVSIDKHNISPDMINPSHYYVGLEDIEKNTGKILPLKLAGKCEIKSNKLYFNSSHILYGKLRPNLNKVALPEVEGVCSTDIYPLSVNETKCDKRYIASILRDKNYVDYATNRAVGINLPRINEKTISEYTFVLPPLHIQVKVADAIDLLTQAIASRMLQIEKLDSLVKSQFIQMFGNPIRKERGYPKKQGIAFFRLSNGKALPVEKRLDHGIPAYGGNGISWYTNKSLCAFDTVVVGRVGFQSGNVHYVKGPLWVTDNAMYISEYARNEYNLVFLYSLMKYIDFTRYQDAGDLKKITQKPFMQMEYITPPLALQTQFADFVQQVEQQKTLLQQSLVKMEENYKSLMQKCFRGEIFS